MNWRSTGKHNETTKKATENKRKSIRSPHSPKRSLSKIYGKKNNVGKPLLPICNPRVGVKRDGGSKGITDGKSR